jgi:hypothetical protein
VDDLFLKRLLAKLRVYMKAAKMAPLKQLALRADQLWMTLMDKKQACKQDASQAGGGQCGGSSAEEI